MLPAFHLDACIRTSGRLSRRKFTRRRSPNESLRAWPPQSEVPHPAPQKPRPGQPRDQGPGRQKTRDVPTHALFPLGLSNSTALEICQSCPKPQTSAAAIVRPRLTDAADPQMLSLEKVQHLDRARQWMRSACTVTSSSSQSTNDACLHPPRKPRSSNVAARECGIRARVRMQRGPGCQGKSWASFSRLPLSL